MPFKKISFYSFQIFLTLCFEMDALAGPFSKNLEKLDQHIQKEIKKGKAIGCAVGIVHKNKIVFLRAYGVQKKGQSTPINLDTMFQLGSISKPLASTLVAVLKKEGKMHLDDSVKPSLNFLKSSTKLKHILSHTAGFKRLGWNAKIESNTPRAKLLDTLSHADQAEPGTEYDYHNFVYSLVENFLEKSQKVPFAELLKNKLFQPLGMQHASVGLDWNTHTNRAWPHQLRTKGSIYPSKSYSKFYHMLVPSAGGINACIRDMVAFLHLQINGKEGLLDKQDLQEFHAPMAQADDAKSWFSNVFGNEVQSYYGLGWRILETNLGKIVFHGGYVKGFKNFLAFSPKHEIGIVILHNCENSFAPKTALKFLAQSCTLS